MHRSYRAVVFLSVIAFNGDGLHCTNLIGDEIVLTQDSVGGLDAVINGSGGDHVPDVLSEIPGVQRVFIQWTDSSVAGTDWVKLSQCAELVYVSITCEGVLTETDADTLCTVGALRTLLLPKVKLSDDSAETLSRLKELRSLMFDGSCITAVGMRVLADAPEIRAIHICGDSGHLPDSVFQELVNCTKQEKCVIHVTRKGAKETTVFRRQSPK